MKTVLRDLNLLFQGKIFETLSETVRDSAKMHGTTFLDFYICRRMKTLRKLDCDLYLLFEGQKFEM